MSIVIVRHPMARLASLYYQKFVEAVHHEFWANLNIYIIEKYRRKWEDGPSDHPKPGEFIR